MIQKVTVKNFAQEFINITLKDTPGARIEVLKPHVFDRYIDLLTVKVNQLDDYAWVSGHREWDVKDFVYKMTAKHCLNVLDKIDHNLAKSIQR